MSDQQKPLTDEDLARFERVLPDRDPADGAGNIVITFMAFGEGTDAETFDSDDALHLVAEVRRLRSEATAFRRAAQVLVALSPRPANATEAAMRDEAIAILSGTKPVDKT